VITTSFVPDFHDYQRVAVSISGGKDSQTMLRDLAAEAGRQGYPRDRITCVFADLGDADEWLSTKDMDARNGTHLVELYGDRPGAAELARLHAEHYGLRFIVTSRLAADGEGGKRPQGLLEHIEARGMWPASDKRYCTSDSKRDPITRVYTQLAAEARQDGHSGPVRILAVLGMRSAESPARAKLEPFTRNERASGKGQSKVVDDWLPIHGMSTAEVWAEIKASKVPYAWTYDAGLPRLSCRFCVLAGKHALGLAAQLDPAGAWERAEAEVRMGHTLRKKMTFLDVLEVAEARPPLAVVDPAAPNPLAWVG
jgi:3'-phosphoadenosine 5'-phosphosulfate sulfotransferase (PAPS reductase)/FAD synthetase